MKTAIPDDPVRAAIRAHAEVYRAPAGFADDVLRSISAQERVQGSVLAERGWIAASGAEAAGQVVAWWRDLFSWGRLGAAFVAGVLVTALGAGWVMEEQRNSEVLVALASDHARAMVSETSLEVVSSNMHTVKPWLSSKLGYSPAVYDLADVDYPLLGGRRGYLGRSALAVMVYGYREHTIDVYVLPQRDTTHLPQSAHVIDGFNTVGWTIDGIQYLAVSDAAAVRVEDFAHRLEARQRAG